MQSVPIITKVVNIIPDHDKVNLIQPYMIMFVSYLLVTHVVSYLLVTHVVSYLLVTHVVSYLLVTHVVSYLLVTHVGECC
jgi:hypothetical protein